MGSFILQPGRIGAPRKLALAVTLLVLPGCSGAASDRAAVSGQVTFDGQPLGSGQVVFEPRGQGRMAIGQLVNGRYSIAAPHGPTAGEYIVRITASRPTGEKASGGPTSGGELKDVYTQFLPAKYNEATELKVQIDPAQGDVEQDFELKSQ
jgi:hypothetical protein